MAVSGKVAPRLPSPSVTKSSLPLEDETERPSLRWMCLIIVIELLDGHVCRGPHFVELYYRSNMIVVMALSSRSRRPRRRVVLRSIKRPNGIAALRVQALRCSPIVFEAGGPAEVRRSFQCCSLGSVQGDASSP